MSSTTTSSTIPQQGTGEKPSVDELRADVERTREELAQTVDALGAKLDVKTRAKARVAETRQQAGALAVRLRASAMTEQGKPTPVALGVAAAAGAALAATGVMIWRMSR